MNIPVEVFADDWEQRARDRFKSAETLLSRGNWQDAYDMAGYSVEFGLKARIMRIHGMNCWPDRKSRPDLYIHDLTSLLIMADLDTSIIGEVTQGTQLGRAWMIAKDWTEHVRYPSGKFPSRRARDMVKAVGSMGVLKWLLS